MPHGLYENHITWSFGNSHVLVGSHVQVQSNNPAGVRQHYNA